MSIPQEICRQHLIHLAFNPEWQEIVRDGLIEQREVHGFGGNESIRTALKDLMGTSPQLAWDRSLAARLVAKNCPELSKAFVPDAPRIDYRVVSKGGRQDYDGISSEAREWVVATFGIDVEALTLAQDQFVALRDEYLLSRKKTTVQLSPDCPPGFKTRFFSTNGRFPVVGNGAALSALIYRQGSALVNIGAAGELNAMGWFTAQERDEVKKLYRRAKPEIRDQAFAMIDDLFERCQKSTGEWTVTGPLSDEDRDDMLTEMTHDEDRQAVRQAYEDSRRITDSDISAFESQWPKKGEMITPDSACYKFILDLFSHNGIFAVWYVDRHALTPEQFKKALFQILKVQLGARFPSELHESYQQALESYMEPKIRESGSLLTVKFLLSVGYGWVQDFKNEVDVPREGEPHGTVPFPDLHHTAQGPYSTTCGYYSLFSLLDSIAQFGTIAAYHGIRTYGDLDRFAAKQQGGSVGSTLETLVYSGNELLAENEKASFRFRRVNPRNVPRDPRHLPRQGFVTAIRTDIGPRKSNVGPHAVHVLGYDAKTGKVRYYDPIGRDGESRIEEITWNEFKMIWLLTEEFGGIIVVEEARDSGQGGE